MGFEALYIVFELPVFRLQFLDLRDESRTLGFVSVDQFSFDLGDKAVGFRPSFLKTLVRSA